MQLRLHTPSIYGVIDAIENDTLMVYPTDVDFSTVLNCNDPVGDDSEMEIEIVDRATLPVSIREWLCVGVQTITAVGPDKDGPGTFGSYRSNIHRVLFTDPSYRAPGPAAHSGIISVSREMISGPTDEVTRDAFRFVVAHELVHAFHAMRFLVPAVMDWNTFYRVALDEGDKNWMAQEILECHSLALDNYRQESELAEVRAFWPSNADRWFNAFAQYAEDLQRRQGTEPQVMLRGGAASESQLAE
ncbi:MAG: hypothetical protein ABMA26_00595 [Limisphaerales bacterium]